MKSASRNVLTILFPLHRALPWLENISENIRLCPPGCRIIISDRTSADCTLTELQKIHLHDPRILFLDKSGPAGWREHVNWLLPRVKSDFFSIMPQDDKITHGYYEKLLNAFITHPDTVLAFGPILAHNIPGKTDPQQFASLPFVTGEKEPWIEAIELEQSWNPGIAYRGLIRRKFARKILKTEGDMQADIIWVFGLALHGRMTEVKDAIYHKRYHPDSAHANWHEHTKQERYRYLVRELKRQYFFKPLTLRKALALLKYNSLR